MKRIKSRKIIIALSLFLLFSLCVNLVAGYRIFTLYRVNLFSKNLSVENNYFLSNNTDSSNWDSYFTIVGLAGMIDASGCVEDSDVNEAEAIGGVDEQYIAYLDIPHINQKEAGLPNGCEAVSATMLLNYYGLDISAEDFVDNYLPMEQIYNKWGFRYGPDPSGSYAGDPKSEKGGWGCFVPVIETALKAYVPSDYTVFNISGVPFFMLEELIIYAQTPVVIWVTQNYSEIKKVYQWQSYDKSETYLYPVNQHCVVLMGCDYENYYIDDPLKDKVVAVPRDKLEKSYASMGSQAIIILKDVNFTTEDR